MELKLYNTASRTKEVFTPLDPKNVRLYVCGPTVYDFAHIGNARPVVVFDVLFRLLRHLYGENHVTYVRNITDVDDKINARAAERKIDIRQLTDETYANFKSDVAALGCLPPTHEPRATEHIKGMVAMIGRLIETGHAYEAQGHVLFDVSSKPDYGKLARRSLDEMIAGARVDVAPYKKNPMDFVLWKPSSAGLPGWDSPWGRGRPGWHIECSAMSEAYLGDSFDIHGGGIDLVFPHHENEIAQSECAHGGARLAKIWMHNGFLQVEGEKMAKSAGNFVTIRELCEVYPGEVVRFALLKSHYRQPLNWTAALREEADEELCGLYLATRDVLQLDEPVPSEVLDALSDDLNTPLMLAALSALRDRASRGDLVAARGLRSALYWLGFRDFFAGLPLHFQDDVITEANFREYVLQENGDLFVRSLVSVIARKLYEQDGSGFDPTLTEKLSMVGDRVRLRTLRDLLPVWDAITKAIRDRLIARKAKNFKEADRIRDELLAQGIVLKDGPDGTTWELKR